MNNELNSILKCLKNQSDTIIFYYDNFLNILSNNVDKFDFEHDFYFSEIKKQIMQTNIQLNSYKNNINELETKYNKQLNDNMDGKIVNINNDISLIKKIIKWCKFFMINHNIEFEIIKLDDSIYSFKNEYITNKELSKCYNNKHKHTNNWKHKLYSCYNISNNIDEFNNIYHEILNINKNKIVYDIFGDNKIKIIAIYKIIPNIKNIELVKNSISKLINSNIFIIPNFN